MTAIQTVGALPDRLTRLLRHLSAQSPLSLNPIIAWIVGNAVGFSPFALGLDDGDGPVTPGIGDAEYDAGTLAGLEAGDEPVGETPDGKGGRVRKGSSGFLGVSLYERTGRWRAQIRVGEAQVHLGYFSTPEEAARAYDLAALEHFGARARVNDQALKAAYPAGPPDRPAPSAQER